MCGNSNKKLWQIWSYVIVFDEHMDKIKHKLAKDERSIKKEEEERTKV